MKPWTITWGTRSWTDDDLMATDLVDLELLIGEGWQSVDPWKSPGHLMVLVSVLESRSSGRPLEEVMAEVRESPAEEIVDTLTKRELQPVS